MSEQPDERDQIEPRVPDATREEITHMRVSEPCGDCMKVRPFKCPRHEARRPEVSEQPLTANREKDIRRRADIGGNISAKMAREVFAALDEARHFATDYATALNDCRDAARAGVPGDEGLRAASAIETAAMGYWGKYQGGMIEAARIVRSLAASPAPAGLDMQRLRRLESFAEKVAASQNDTPGTRAAARYALTGSLEGVVDEMRLASERP